MRLSCSIVLLSVTISGCTQLSKEGPSAFEIEKQATVTIDAKARAQAYGYVLLDITPTTASLLGSVKRPSLYGSFGNFRSAAPTIRFGVGDVVQVSVFEAQTGGLFIPQDAGARPGNYVTLPQQQVDNKGNVNIPYAGEVKFAGRTISDVQKEIAGKLSNRAIEPQVVISLGTQRANQVSVLGEVRAPARVDVNPSGEKILDVIARAGGPSHPSYETYVTVERGGRRSTVFFDDIVKNARENIYIHPNDTVYLSKQAASFVVFGATNSRSISTTNKVNFESDRLSLAEALAKIGGLDDQRADAKRLFIYREVETELITKLGVDVTRSKAGKGYVPVILRVNLRDPSAYFLAKQFDVLDKDLIYVDNSDSYDFTKFLDLVSRSSSTVTGVANSVTATRDARAALRN